MLPYSNARPTPTQNQSCLARLPSSRHAQARSVKRLALNSIRLSNGPVIRLYVSVSSIRTARAMEVRMKKGIAARNRRRARGPSCQ